MLEYTKSNYGTQLIIYHKNEKQCDAFKLLLRLNVQKRI